MHFQRFRIVLSMRTTVGGPIVKTSPAHFVGDNGWGVWRFWEANSAWEPANTGLTNGYIRKLAVAPDGTLFAACNGGQLFMTRDDGDQRVNVSAGLPGNHTLVDIAFDSAGHVYVADVNGVYRSWEAILTTEREDNATVPDQFSLSQNYPNPFNPETLIRYTIAGSKEVRLVVYDVLGREVAMLVNEVKQPGTYTVQLDGSKLASSLYLCRLRAGSFVQTTKMLLLR